MNWGIRVVGKAADISDLIDNAVPSTAGEQEPTQDVNDQVACAKAAAHAVVSSGCVGEDVIYSIGLEGYANEGHVHEEGNPQDSVNVQVFQATEDQLAEHEEA